MKRLYRLLPGPPVVKVLTGIVVLVVALVVLFFVYDWLGTVLLDSGGSIG